MKALQSRILPSEHSVLLPPQGLLLPGALMTSFLLLCRLHYLQDCPFFILLGPVACHSPYCLRSFDTTVLTPWNLPHFLTASCLPLSHLTCESPYTSSVSLSWENSASVCHLAWWRHKGTLIYYSLCEWLALEHSFREQNEKSWPWPWTSVIRGLWTRLEPPLPSASTVTFDSWFPDQDHHPATSDSSANSIIPNACWICPPE